MIYIVTATLISGRHYAERMYHLDEAHGHPDPLLPSDYKVIISPGDVDGIKFSKEDSVLWMTPDATHETRSAVKARIALAGFDANAPRQERVE